MDGMTVRRRLAWLAAVWLAAAALVDCSGGCGCGQSQEGTVVPATPAERLTVFSQRLPAQTDLALFFVDMDAVRQSGDVLSKKFSGSLPLDAYRQEVRQVTGVDVLDKASYEKAGLHPDGGFAVGYHRDAAVALFYVTDKAAFEKGLLTNLKRYYRMKDVQAKPLEGSKTAFVVEDKGVSFGYAHLGSGLTVMVGQAAVSGAKARDVSAILKDAMAVEEASSLSKAAGFEGFKAQVGDGWPASVYMNTPKLLSLYQGFDPSLKTYQKEVMDAVGEQIGWVGFGWKADGKQATGKAFFGVQPETLERFKGLEKPSKGAPRFKHLVMDKAYAFLRVSLNAEIFWREYFKLMPERQQRYFKKIVGNLKSSTQIDVEKDLINNLTGHGAVAVYGVNPLMYMARRANQRMKVVTLALHIQVKDPQRLIDTLDRITKEMGTSIQRRTLPGKVQVWGFDPESMTAPPFALYIKDDLLTLASTDLGDERIGSMLMGDAPKLRNQISGEATTSLLEGETASGLYINMPRIQQQLGLVGGKMVRDILGPQKELTVLVSVQPENKGLAAEGSLTFAGAGGDDAGAGEDKKASPDEKKEEGGGEKKDQGGGQ